MPTALNVEYSLSTTAHAGRFRASWTMIGQPRESDDGEVILSAGLLGQDGAAIVNRDLQAVTTDALQLLEAEKVVGQRLFDALFQRHIRARYEEAYTQARNEHKRLRIWLHIPPELENLPFELLYDPSHRMFLAANAQIAIVRGSTGRRVDLSKSLVRFPFRLLIVCAQPHDVAPVAMDHELKILQQGLSKAVQFGFWQFDVLRGPDTLRQLHELPHRHEYHVIHFIGHGMIDHKTSESVLVFANQDGNPQFVSGATLGPLLADFTSLRLVVLNSCHGGHALESRPYAGIAHALLATEIAAVIVMQRAVGDDSAVRFADEFYRNIGRSLPVDKSVGDARMSLNSYARVSGDVSCALDWFNPQVYLHARDGELFNAMSQELPWEGEIKQALELDNISAALALLESLGKWEELEESLCERVFACQRAIAQNSIAKRRWLDLSTLGEICQGPPGTAQEVENWSRMAANRLRWTTTTLPDIGHSLRAGDLLQASRAYWRCQHMIGLLGAADREGAIAQLYDRDVKLRSEFWSSDLEELRELAQTYRGPIVSEAVVELAQVLKNLGENEGLVVRAIDCPVPRVCVHPLGDGHRLGQIAQRIVGDDSYHELSLNELMKCLAEELGPDAPLVKLALGWTEAALTEWEKELRREDFPSVHRCYELHHHLALSGFPPERDSGSGSPPYTCSLSAQQLGSWAVLTASGQRPAEYWLRLSGADSLSSSEAELRTLAQWLELRLDPMCADGFLASESSSLSTSSRSNQTRGVTLVAMDQIPSHSSISRPSKSAPHPLAGTRSSSKQVRQFRFERAGASLMNALVQQGLIPAGPPCCGYRGMLAFEQQRFVAQACQALHTATPRNGAWGNLITCSASQDDQLETYSATSPTIQLRQLMVLFSEIGQISCELAQEDWPSVARDVGQLQIHLPPETNAGAFEFLESLPLPFRPQRTKCRAEEFALWNPAYASLNCEDHLAEDLRELSRLLLVHDLRSHLDKSPPDISTAIQRINDLILIALGRPLEEIPDFLSAQQRATAIASGFFENVDSDRVRQGVALLEALGRLNPSGKTNAILAEGWLSYAKQLLEEGYPEASIARLYEAIHLAPECQEARELLCAGLLAKAESLYSENQRTLSREILVEFTRHRNELQQPSLALMELCHRARELENQLSAPEMEATVDELIGESVAGIAAKLQTARSLFAVGQLDEAVELISNTILICDDGASEQTEAIVALLDILDTNLDLDFEYRVVSRLAACVESPMLRKRLEELQ